MTSVSALPPRWRAAITLAIALVLAGCAAAGGPTGPLEPLVVGAEQHLTLEWQTQSSEQGAVVWGYVHNRSPYTFDRVRLLVDALGPSGEILGQQLVWAMGVLGSWGRNYFEARLGPAASYRVRIFSYDRVESDRFRRRPFP